MVSNFLLQTVLETWWVVSVTLSSKGLQGEPGNYKLSDILLGINIGGKDDAPLNK